MLEQSLGFHEGDEFSEREEEAAEDDGRGAAAGVTFGSLGEALVARRIPIENHEVIRQITEAVGVGQYVGMSSYIKAVRIDGRGPDLHIHYGYTNGIPDESTAEAILERLSPSDRAASEHYRSVRKRGIAHPANKTRPGGGGAKTKRDYGTCPGCYTKIYANGTCNCPD